MTLAGLLLVLSLAFGFASESKHLPITFKGLDAGSFLTDLFTNGIPVVAFSMAAIALVGVLAWQELRSRRTDAPVRLFLLAMIALALALSAMVDLITLDGDIDRMNTVFKFYIHIWILLALAGAFGIWYVFAVLGWRPRLPGGKMTGKAAGFSVLSVGWLAALVILVGGGLIYPIAGTRARGEHQRTLPAVHEPDERRHGLHGVRRLRGRERQNGPFVRLRGDPVDAAERAGDTGYRGGEFAELSLGLPLFDLHRLADRRRLGLAPAAATRPVRGHGERTSAGTSRTSTPPRAFRRLTPS